MSEPAFVFEEAPSIEVIVAATERVGTIDFTVPAPRRGDEPDGGVDDAPGSEVDELAALLDAAARQPEPAPAEPAPASTSSVSSARSVDEVAAEVADRMRSIGVAHERHVEALELEAARRCELLTAQAELDAELIRLHARREAHAIVAAARLDAGVVESGAEESEQLEAIGLTFVRFAESIEAEADVDTGPPEPHRWS